MQSDEHFGAELSTKDQLVGDSPLFKMIKNGFLRGLGRSDFKTVLIFVISDPENGGGGRRSFIFQWSAPFRCHLMLCAFTS